MKKDVDIQTFCEMIRHRSEENARAMRCFSIPHGVLSPAFSILRQELDSMVRVIYLLAMEDLTERRKFIQATLRGEKWKVRNVKGGFRYVTDCEMVDLAQRLQGWTQSVYKFGCAFVHLSDFHNHFVQNPFEKLSHIERQHVILHMRHYHGGPCHDNPSMEEISIFIPRVFDKIAGNLECYLGQLKRDETINGFRLKTRNVDEP